MAAEFTSHVLVKVAIKVLELKDKTAKGADFLFCR